MARSLPCDPGATTDSDSNLLLRHLIRARFLAEFTLSTQSEILRFAQDDSEGLGMRAHLSCVLAC